MYLPEMLWTGRYEAVSTIVLLLRVPFVVSSLRSVVFPFSWRHVVRPPIFFVSMGRAFWMVGGVFHALNRRRFGSLISIGKVLNRVFCSIRFV